jgi:CHASE2 domain-containing sensor protein/signal transduction histidine kinase
MKRLHWEWLSCTVAVLFFMGLTELSGVLHRFDMSVYDKLLQLRSRPVPHEIVIISIDDDSLQAIGAWPWQRDKHAAMLSQLALAKPKAVALDLLFLEHSAQVESDEALAKALRLPGLGKVFLPITLQSPIVYGRALIWEKPIAVLANAVKGFGHINVELDDDGIARSMYVFADHLQAKWQSLPMQLFLASGQTQKTEFVWPSLQDNRVSLLPFSGSRAHFRTVSFVSVLRGEVPASVFTEKLVLVGVTGTGLGDQYPTPLSANGALTPGVQIVATALEGLLQGSLILPLATSAHLVLNAVLAVLFMLVLYPLGPRRSITELLIALILAVALSGFTLVYGRVWWPNTVLWLGMLLGYLLWSWRRVTVMFTELRLHAKKLSINETEPDTPLAIEKPWHSNEWQAILDALDSGLRTTKMNKKRVADTLNSLPEAVLLTNAEGRIEMANIRARALLKLEKLENQNALPLICKLDESELNAVATWDTFMSRICNTQGNGLEIMLSKDSYVLLRATAIKNLKKSLTSNAELDIDASWWIVIIVDVSKQKQMQRQRSDALQLLWHDLRAPQSAILTLLRMQGQGDGHDNALNEADLHERISAQVQETLDLADGFVWQLRAESDELNFCKVDMVQLINEVIDRVWPMAKVKNISISFDYSNLPTNVALRDTVCDNEAPLSEEYKELWLTAEPGLMRRAIYNLVENAVKYSPMNSNVQIFLHLKNAIDKVAVAHACQTPQMVEINIKDEGYGILKENLLRVFEPYTRFSSPTRLNTELDLSESTGYGLGLRLVKTVVEAHKGSIRCTSEPSRGSIFTIELPRDPFVL